MLKIKQIMNTWSTVYWLWIQKK